jgi:hypothetical protein
LSLLIVSLQLQGYNGSQLWDTAFAVQALAATEMIEETAPILKRANHYIDKAQVRKRVTGLWGFLVDGGLVGFRISICMNENIGSRFAKYLLLGFRFGSHFPLSVTASEAVKQ